jgi:hypothetical protein
MEKEKIKSIIREITKEVIDEMTTTGAVAAYQTPYAFQGGASDKARKKKLAQRSMPGGKVVKDIYEEVVDYVEVEKALPVVRRGLKEGRSRYRNFKESDLMKNHAKVSYGIRNAKKILREVDFLISICERLKTDESISTDNLWKRTPADLVEISHRIKEIQHKLRRMHR